MTRLGYFCSSSVWTERTVGLQNWGGGIRTVSAMVVRTNIIIVVVVDELID